MSIVVEWATFTPFVYPSPTPTMLQFCVKKTILVYAETKESKADAKKQIVMIAKQRGVYIMKVAQAGGILMMSSHMILKITPCALRRPGRVSRIRWRVRWISRCPTI